MPARIVCATLVALATLAGCSGGDARPEPATLVISDARIWTGNPHERWAEAIASRDGRIVAVGTRAEVQPYIGADTEVVTAPGALLVPGFVDAHVHFADGGAALASVQLRDAATPAEFTARIAEYASRIEPGEWILQGTWDHENWGGELPRRDWIDAVTPDNPVWIQRLDGHMALANSLALAAAGVDADTPDIPGGEIVRYDDGRPTGILKDNAMVPVSRAVPPPTAEQIDRQIRAAMQHVASHGITTVHDMALDGEMAWRSLDAYRRLHAAGELITRIYAVMPLADWERLLTDVENNGTGDAWLRTGGLKGFMDGSLGSHTAAFFEPFSDAPDDRGMMINELDDMRAWIEGADAAGLQVNVHAIGDRANAELLDIYLDVVETNGDRDRRFRIEHAQHLRPSDIPRFAAQKVIASMQPYHAIDDGQWAERVIGPERIKTTYAFRSLLDAGASLAFGSDWFVAPADPIAGIHAAVTRQTLDGKNPDGWVPEEKISVEQALRAYTADAAHASFEEDSKGMIRPGMLADLVLLDRDITSIAPDAIQQTQVVMTIVGGSVVYER